MSRYKQLNSTREALEEVSKAVDAVSDADGFMVAVWEVRDGRINYKGKTTRNFPTADYLTAASQVLNDFQTEAVEESTPPPPLPMAQFLGESNDS